MFARMRKVGVSAACVSLAAVGCNGPVTPHEMQIAHMDETREHHPVMYNQLSDNGRVHNMSLADHHFVAHTDELSGTGTACLERMVDYLNAYGGTVRYETYNTDDGLVNRRINHVREYLKLVGCTMRNVSVRRMISGGRGTTGRNAVDVEIRGTAKPDSANAAGMAGTQN